MLKIKLFICLLLLQFENIYSQTICKENFEILNLNYPGLENVKTNYEKGDLENAAKCLLDYYRNRSDIKHPDLDLSNVTYSSSDKKMADEALCRILYAHEGYQPSLYYGKDINWRYWPIKDGELRLQLHRHTWFIPMGKVYYVTKDERYAKEWMFQYMDWVKDNPMVVDISKSELEKDDKLKSDYENAQYAWRPLEVGGRLLGQTQQFMLFNKSENFTPDFLMFFLSNYYNHASYLINHYSAAGNHLLFEAMHMVYAGTFFPEFKDAKKWRKSGIDILVSEIKKQVFDDGCQFELDPLYHLASIEIFTSALFVLQVNNASNEIPEEYMKSIEKMITFYYNICYPDYTNPCFSDAKRRGKENKIKNYKKWSPLFPDNQQIRYFMSEGKEGKKPENLSKGFLNGGFFVFRNGWDKSSTVMILKAGPKGEWHNQPDNGTFELWYNGTNLFPDSGFYIYGGDENVWKQRNWFRQTMVHNTLTLNNRNLEEQASKTLLWKPESKTPVLVTENNSYKNLKHRRSVFFVDGKYFVIVDEAVGSALGNINLHYQLKEGKVDIDKLNNVLISDYVENNNVKLQCFAPDKAFLVEEEGWQSTHYLEKERRTAVSFQVKKENTDPVRYITVIYPFNEKNAIPEIKAEFIDKEYNDKSLRLKVCIDGKTKKLSYNLK